MSANVTNTIDAIFEEVEFEDRHEFALKRQQNPPL